MARVGSCSGHFFMISVIVKDRNFLGITPKALEGQEVPGLDFVSNG
jgi:hypothetical protein